MDIFPNGIKGLSDSKWSGLPGSAHRLVGIDLHSTPGLIKVHQKLSKSSPDGPSAHEVTELCKYKIGASNGTTLWFSAESGKIWREVSGVWALAYTTVPTSGEAKCLGAAEFDKWVIWATENYIHRIHIDDINATWSNHVYQNYADFGIGDNEFHPMIEQNLELFIGDKTAISKITFPTTTNSNPTTAIETTLGSAVASHSFASQIKATPDSLRFPEILASAREAYPFASTPTYSFSALLVGGGGGGGGGGNGATISGGGGGAGQVLPQSFSGIAEDTIAITIGAGGTAGSGGAVATAGGDGGATSIGALATAIGGGGGASGSAATGRAGASGGGGANASAGGTGTAGSNGGSSSNSGVKGGGGGGGASAVGANGDAAIGGTGGSGTASSISGSSVTYAGGGGGGGGAGGSGGAGGGGAGGSSGAGTAATANTGGGGGGGAGTSGNGGSGGSGVVIISYPTGSMTATGGTITTSGGNTIHTFTSSGSFIITTATITQSFTVPPGHDRALYAFVANYTPTAAASAMFNGTAMTLVESVNKGSGPASIAVFRLLNPTATTANIVVTWAAATYSQTISAVVLDNVDQADPDTDFLSTISTPSTQGLYLLDAPVEYAVRIGYLVSDAATHTPLTTGLTELLDGTNFVGRDSVSYIGTSTRQTLLETDFNIRTPERIQTLIDFDTDVLIGTKRANKGRVLRWDTASESWSAEDTVEENGVNAFIRDDNYVYAQAGDFGRLYFYNGEQLLPYQRIPGDWSPTSYGIVHQSAVAFFMGVPVFGFSSTTGDPTLQGVYSFGSYSKDYPKVLDLSFPVSSGALSGLEVGAVLVKGADLMVAWKDANGAGVDKLDYSAKYGSAYIETMMLSGPKDRGLLKTVLNACAYYASLPAGTGVTFGYRKAYETDYASLTPVTDAKLCAVKVKEATIPEVANLQLRFGFTVNANDAPEVEDFEYK